jgi:hypothetical protein
MTASIEGSYPHVARWVATHGWIELGQTEHSASLVRALDEGGLVWEGAATYQSLDRAVRALDEALASWLDEQLGERPLHIP